MKGMVLLLLYLCGIYHLTTSKIRSGDGLGSYMSSVCTRQRIRGKVSDFLNFYRLVVELDMGTVCLCEAHVFMVV
jgi:hypothetical protein